MSSPRGDHRLLDAFTASMTSLRMASGLVGRSSRSRRQLSISVWVCSSSSANFSHFHARSRKAWCKKVSRDANSRQWAAWLLHCAEVALMHSDGHKACHIEKPRQTGVLPRLRVPYTGEPTMGREDPSLAILQRSFQKRGDADHLAETNHKRNGPLRVEAVAS